MITKSDVHSQIVMLDIIEACIFTLCMEFLLFFVVGQCPVTWTQVHNFCALQDCYLVYILTEKSQCTIMVFTRTCDATLILASMLRNLGIRATPISGHMSQVCHTKLTLMNVYSLVSCYYGIYLTFLCHPYGSQKDSVP